MLTIFFSSVFLCIVEKYMVVTIMLSFGQRSQISGSCRKGVYIYLIEMGRGQVKLYKYRKNKVKDMFW
ncbi:unnamed protein product, partial [Urochloa humidicola]